MFDSKYLVNMEIHYDGTFKYKFTVSNWVSTRRLVSQGNHSQQSSRNYFFFYSLVIKHLLCLLLMFNGSSTILPRLDFYPPQFSYPETAIRRKDQQYLGGQGFFLTTLQPNLMGALLSETFEALLRTYDTLWRLLAGVFSEPFKPAFSWVATRVPTPEPFRKVDWMSECQTWFITSVNQPPDEFMVWWWSLESCPLFYRVNHGSRVFLGPTVSLGCDFHLLVRGFNTGVTVFSFDAKLKVTRTTFQPPGH